VSAWQIIGLQVLTGSTFCAALAWVYGRAVGVSAAYGVLAVVCPAILLAYGLSRQVALKNAGVAFMSFVVWELVKVVVTVVLLLAAPKLVPALNWLALVAGFVVAMKVYWVAAWLHSSRRSLNSLN
jgi:ATP synthase protein I